MCSIIGRLTSGSIGLGALEVSGRRRVPSPPAMITAFMAEPTPAAPTALPSPARRPALAQRPQADRARRATAA